MLRISRVDQDRDGLCLQVEGRLSGEGVALLEGELADASRTSQRLSLDLSSVDFASLPAVQMLRAAATRGVHVVACSPLLAELLVKSPS